MGSTAATPAGKRRAANRAPAKRPDPRRKQQGAGGGTGKRRKPTSSSRAGQGSGGSRGRPRRTPKPRARAAGRKWRRRLLVGAAVLCALTAGYFAWLRDSSLVAVTSVTVNGVESGDHERIVAELTRAGESMTTLNVDREQLDRIASGFPTVASVSADPSFPNGLEIDVAERPPALAARSDGAELAVAADGTVLPGVEAADHLPRVELGRVPRSGRLEGDALAQARAIGAAPEPLARLVRGVRQSRQFGVEVRLRGGIQLRFGTGAKASEKWAAAAAVLADPELDVAAYVDVRVPERPAVGGTEA